MIDTTTEKFHEQLAKPRRAVEDTFCGLLATKMCACCIERSYLFKLMRKCVSVNWFAGPREHAGSRQSASLQRAHPREQRDRARCVHGGGDAGPVAPVHEKSKFEAEAPRLPVALARASARRLLWSTPPTRIVNDLSILASLTKLSEQVYTELEARDDWTVFKQRVNRILTPIRDLTKK